MTDAFSDVTAKIISRYKLHASSSAFTVAISGIDASGKGYVTKQLTEELVSRGYKVAGIHLDPWQKPLPVRLKKDRAAENFYNNAFRWRDFFEQLICPLQKNKSIYLAAKAIQTHADEYYPIVYEYKDIEILMMEGIFLFKKQYLPFYDYKIWIDCSFETALKRALKRNVEKLDEEKLLHDYHTFYYPAQRLHFERDDPQMSADCVFCNEV